MLQEFGVRNFFSFKDWACISLELDANCPSNITNGTGFATVIGIKGANASGKTQLLKAFTFVAHFCSKSFSTDPEIGLKFSPFFDSQKNTDFHVEFSVDDTIYKYELICNKKEVISEIIFKKKLKFTKIFERRGNDIYYTTKEFNPLKKIKLRSNASIISTAHQYDLEELRAVHTFFNQINTNVGHNGLRTRPVNISTVSEYLHDNNKALEFISTFVSQCDTGVDTIQIYKSKGQDGNDEFNPTFSHRTQSATHEITEYAESSGTKALYLNLPIYQIVLKRGGVLALDEFDMHLHPHILPKLLNLFLDKSTNPKNAQLIFTSHDTNILDILGRYRVYLVNKQDNESFVYRLDEIPGDILRNDRPIVPAYNLGKIGGVPKI